MGCACTLLGKDDLAEEQEEGQNDTCPKCGKEFETGDQILMDPQNTVYHYDCVRNPSLFKEGLVQ
jgi:hypothetical protein